MDREAGRGARRGRNVLFSLFRLALVAVPGFAIGLFAGVLWEDPRLILGDLAGGSEEVAWGTQAEPAADTAFSEGSASPPEVGGDGAPGARRVPDVAAAPPPTLPTATQAAVAAAPSGGKLAVQVGAFADSRSAEKLAASLRSAGLPVFVSPSAASEGDKRWRVRVGPLATREEADRIAARLKAREKLPTWVLPADGA